MRPGPDRRRTVFRQRPSSPRAWGSGSSCSSPPACCACRPSTTSARSPPSVRSSCCARSSRSGPVRARRGPWARRRGL